MDATENDVEVSDDDLMAQMGFSSFGAASPPSKRRRYNPNADALLPSKSSATGANSTALGTGSNKDEISLDDDNEGNANPEQKVPAQARRLAYPRDLLRRKPRLKASTQAHMGPGIEKARGLTTRGTWITRNAGNAATTGDAPA
ncbi:hypothetical protein NW765_009573 [Fusarium oxysporum]|nr:hypothetical protein NW765_009573 [Fusarium oxysporum]